MTAETDAEFVGRVSRAIYDRNSTHKDADLIRLFALARRGAAAIADDRCKKDTKVAFTNEDFMPLPPPPSGEPMKLNIDEAKFLAAVDREGDHEIGVGKFPTPPSGEPRDE